MNGAAGSSLAVIIPAYRGEYLAETLRSLEAQSCRDFRVYVADDGSPEPIGRIVADFAGKMDLVYHRFPTNLGHESLVNHWDRAIELSREPFVWLFSDDDVASPDCVRTFYDDLGAAPESRALRRFDLEFIGPDGVRLLTEPEFPQQLSDAAYTRHLLHTLTATCVMQNMVFPRAVYEEERGFADFPGGYCTDCATWPRFARQSGVRRLAGGRVSFRRHGGAMSITLLQQLSDWRPLIASYGATLHEMRRSLGEGATTRHAEWRAELVWFCRWFRYYPRPLSKVELAFARAEMGLLWPERPLSRRIVFGLNYVASRLRRNRFGGRLLQARRQLFGFVSPSAGTRAGSVHGNTHH